MYKLIVLFIAFDLYGQMHDISLIPSAETIISNRRPGGLNFISKDRLNSARVEGPYNYTGNVVLRIPNTNAVGCLLNDGVGNTTWGACGGSGSAPTLLYLYSSFRDDDAGGMYFHYSYDGINWYAASRGRAMSSGLTRDPSIIEMPDGSANKFVIVNSPNFDTFGHSVQVFKTNDLLSFNGKLGSNAELIPAIELDMTPYYPGVYELYAPENFHDPVTDKYGFVVAMAAGGPFTPHWVQYDQATDATSDSTIDLTGTSQNLAIDLFMHYDATGGANPYYLFITDLGFLKQYISYATGPTVNGPFVVQKPVPTAFGGVDDDYFKFGPQAEGESIVDLPDGCKMVYADTYIGVFEPRLAASRRYTVKYVRTCGTVTGGTQDANGVWSSDTIGSGGGVPFSHIMNYPLPLNISAAEHGTVIKITNPATIAIVLNAAAKTAAPLDSGYIPSRLQVGGQPSPQGKFDLEIKSNNAALGLQFPSPPSIALTTVDGHTAALSGCGPNYITCPPPQPGDAVHVILHDSTRNSPMIQLTNTGPDYGETAIAFSQGNDAFGNDLHSVSSMDKHAIWTFGMMNTYFGNGIPGRNYGNNELYAYNAGLGASLVADPVIINPDFETGVSTWVPAGGLTNANVTSSTEQAHGGLKSMKVDAVGFVYQGTSITGLTVGQNYNFNVWTFGTAAQTSYVQIEVHDGQNLGSVSSLPIAIGPYWQLLSVSFPPTARADAFVSLKVGSVAGGPVYFDDVSATTPIGSFPFSVSAQTGVTRANYGIGLGGGNATSLQSTNWGNLYAFGPGFMSLGNGIPGNQLGYLSLGTLSAFGDIYLGPQLAETGNITITSPGFIAIGSGTHDNHSAFVALGTLSAEDFILLGPRFAERVSLCSPPGGHIINIGDQSTVCNTAGGISAGIVNVTTLNSDQAYVGTSLTIGNNFNPTLPFVNVTSPGNGFLQFNRANTNDASATVTAGTFNAGIMNVTNVNSGTTYAGDALVLGNNFNPGSPLGKLDVPSSGFFRFSTGGTLDGNATLSGGYFNARNLFSVNGVNGVTSGLTVGYGCNTATVTFKNQVNVNQTITYCTSLQTFQSTFTGGIRTQ